MDELRALERIAGPISLTDDEIEQSRSGLERNETPVELETVRGGLPAEIANMSVDALGKLISKEAHDLVFFYEVAGKSGYLRKYKSPVWPGLSSGITIGIGYDVGYDTTQAFHNNWKPLLPEADFTALALTVQHKGDAARRMLPQVSHVTIPWDDAVSIYQATTVPTFARLVLSTFPNSQELHPHSFGALFSLVYNRGSSLTGPKRQHMRNIHQHMEQRRFGQVPREIRNMKVLWATNMSGLLKRRDSEAMLFEQGLIEADRQFFPFQQTSSTQAPSAQPVTSISSEIRGDSHSASVKSGEHEDGDWVGQPEDHTDDMPQLRSVDHAFESRGAPWTAISWVQDDDNSTEYRHINQDDRALRDCEFEFSGRDLDLLLHANAFEVSGKFIFGLRGAILLGSTASPDDRFFQIERSLLRIKESRPDHQNFKCVIGVYDPQSNRISGFIASTVARRDAVFGYATKSSPACNLLPSGCYIYEVGSHRGKAGCLRETEQYGVLRNRDNMTYDTKDVWDNCFPADNIHPSFIDPSGSAKFSSLGCQVIQGSINKATGEHTGVWSKFRTTLGLLKPGSGDHQKRFSYVLLTGLEAAIASRLREKGADSDTANVMRSLGRLRHGSRGESVRRLQAALALEQTGFFDAKTKVSLAKRQAEKFRWADAVYYPAMDQQLNFSVFDAEVSAPVVVASNASVKPAAGEIDAEGLSNLYREIGQRTRENLTSSASPDLLLDTETTRGVADLVAIGQRVFMRIELAAHDLICGTQAQDTTDRANIQNALVNAAKLGNTQVVDQLTSILVSSLGIINPVAAIAAKIIVQRILQPALQDAQSALAPTIGLACTAWKRELDRRVDTCVIAPRSEAGASEKAPASG